jgi:hypothetical protein
VKGSGGSGAGRWSQEMVELGVEGSRTGRQRKRRRCNCSSVLALLSCSSLCSLLLLKRKPSPSPLSVIRCRSSREASLERIPPTVLVLAPSAIRRNERRPSWRRLCSSWCRWDEIVLSSSSAQVSGGRRGQAGAHRVRGSGRRDAGIGEHALELSRWPGESRERREGGRPTR